MPNATRARSTAGRAPSTRSWVPSPPPPPPPPPQPVEPPRSACRRRRRAQPPSPSPPPPVLAERAAARHRHLHRRRRGRADHGCGQHRLRALRQHARAAGLFGQPRRHALRPGLPVAGGHRVRPPADPARARWVCGRRRVHHRRAARRHVPAVPARAPQRERARGRAPARRLSVSVAPPPPPSPRQRRRRRRRACPHTPSPPPLYDRDQCFATMLETRHTGSILQRVVAANGLYEAENGHEMRELPSSRAPYPGQPDVSAMSWATTAGGRARGPARPPAAQEEPCSTALRRRRPRRAAPAYAGGRSHPAAAAGRAVARSAAEPRQPNRRPPRRRRLRRRRRRPSAPAAARSRNAAGVVVASRRRWPSTRTSFDSEAYASNLATVLHAPRSRVGGRAVATAGSVNVLAGSVDDFSAAPPPRRHPQADKFASGDGRAAAGALGLCAAARRGAANDPHNDAGADGDGSAQRPRADDRRISRRPSRPRAPPATVRHRRQRRAAWVGIIAGTVLGVSDRVQRRCVADVLRRQQTGGGVGHSARPAAAAPPWASGGGSTGQSLSRPRGVRRLGGAARRAESAFAEQAGDAPDDAKELPPP